MKKTTLVLLSIVMTWGCKGVTEPNEPIPPLIDTVDNKPAFMDPDELVELITDTTWFDSCGCLEGRFINYFYQDAKKIFLQVDTEDYSIIDYTMGALFYNSNPWADKEFVNSLEMLGYPYFNCNFAFLSLEDRFYSYHICNFPGDKIATDKPFVCKVTIEGKVYFSYYDLENSLGNSANSDLFLTSMKIPRKYLKK